MVILLPISVFVFGRKERKNRKLEKATLADFLLLPLGASNPNAQAPRWLKYPLFALLFLLIGIFVLIILGVSISYIAGRFFG
jgi:hypothetical protein